MRVLSPLSRRFRNLVSALALSLCYLGAEVYAQGAGPCNFGVAFVGFPIIKSQIEEVVQRRGCFPRNITFFLQWEPTFYQAVPLRDTLMLARSYGVLPILTWEPSYWTEDKRSITIEADDIIAGKYDAYIDAVARVLKEYNGPVMIRLAHEMNLQQYHWGMGDAARYSLEGAFAYQKLYRAIVRRVRKITGSDGNVKFIFNPNHESVPFNQKEHAWNTLKNYYPGGEFVDVVGLDSYNWGDTVRTPEWNSSWKTPEELLSAAVKELREVAPGKPIYIFEAASVGDDPQKEAWLSQMLQYISKEGLYGLTWFHVDKERDWRLPRK